MSVRDVIAALPGIDEVRERSPSLAVLDAVRSPEWELRYFSYDADWAPGEQMASVRDGSGDEYAIVSTRHGAWARGFAHESPMSPYRTRRPPSSTCTRAGSSLPRSSASSTPAWIRTRSPKNSMRWGTRCADGTR